MSLLIISTLPPQRGVRKWSGLDVALGQQKQMRKAPGRSPQSWPRQSSLEKGSIRSSVSTNCDDRRGRLTPLYMTAPFARLPLPIRDGPESVVHFFNGQVGKLIDMPRRGSQF
jgi:hypothetical protein